jgi:hypothetical protein
MAYWDPDTPDRLVTVAEYDNLHQAITGRMLLEAAGIEAFIADENLARIAGPLHLVFGGRVRLQVLESEAEDALRVLNTPAPDLASGPE